jgi:DNA invertase Pin-like site-specific DNA recombinase
VVVKLDRLARSLPDARAIADELTRRHVKLNLGGSVHDPDDPVGRLLFNRAGHGRRVRGRSHPGAYARGE